MSAAAGRPNFFILLELDPDAPWDKDVYKRQLDAKRNKWSAMSNGVGPTKIEGTRNRELLSDIQRVMENESLREREAEDAKRLRRAAQSEQQDRLTAILKVAEAKGYVLDSEIAAWRRELLPDLSEAQIRAKITVPVLATPKPPKSSAAGLSTTVATEIRTQLAALADPDIDSLYTFLTVYTAEAKHATVSKSSTCAELKAAADAVYGWTQNQANKTGKVTAAAKLAGLAASNLGSDAQRALYDFTLARVPLQDLLGFYAKVCKDSGIITRKQVDSFVADAKKLGLSAEEAQAELAAMAEHEKLKLIPASDEPAIQRCYVCDAPNDPSNLNCTVCGKPIWVDCPNGDATHLPATTQFCSVCRLEIGARYRIADELDACEKYIRNADWDLADRKLTWARAVWKVRHPDDLVRRMDTLDQQIKPERERINREREVQRQREEDARRQEHERLEAERAARDAAVTAIEASLHSRRLYEARRLLAEAPRATGEHPDYGTKRDGLKSIVDAGIAKAERQVKLAREAHERGDDDEAVRQCYEALAVCDDCQAARDLLARLPVSPPRNVRIEAVGTELVKVTWEASTDPGVDGYTVAYKVGSAPANAEDGRMVAIRLPNAVSAEDRHAERGVVLRYGVFARAQGRAASRPTPSQPGAILLAAPIEDLCCDVTPKEVHLSWRSPSPHLRAIHVRRAQGDPPQSITDGEPLRDVAPTGVTDREVQAGTRYGYAVFAEYTGITGGPVWSAPATIRATPQTPPAPVSDLRADNQTDMVAYAKVLLTCTRTRPSAGEVTILKANGAEFALRPRMPWAALAASGSMLSAGKLPAEDAAGHRVTYTAKDTWLAPGVCTYVPVVRLDDMGYLGKPLRHVCVNEVADLSRTYDSVKVRLRWRWPQACERVEVLHHASRWPTSGANLSPISIARGGAAPGTYGSYDVQHEGKTEAFFVVTAYASVSGGELASAGKRCRIAMGKKPQLDISVVTRFGRSRGVKLSLQGSQVAPALVLVMNRERPPADALDGEALYWQESTQWLHGEITPKMTGDPLPSGAYIRVFLTDDGEREAIEVPTTPLKVL